MVPILRDAGLAALLDPEAALVERASGLEFTEGPLWLPDGALLFQDLKTERTYRLRSEGRLEVLREATGAANGQTFDASGRIVFCEQNGRRVSRMNRDGTGVETVVDSYEGRRLNSPNDIVARSDGTLFFTDPPYGAPPDRPLDFQGVYAIDPSGILHLLLDDFEKPNGLALSPDERTLYVCDTGRYHIRAFDLAPQPGIGLVPNSGRTLAVMNPAETGGPDGMKVDRDGRLYVAVAQGVWVYEPTGQLLGILATPSRPSNLAWCGPEADRLAITMGNRVLEARLRTRGCPPPFQQA